MAAKLGDFLVNIVTKADDKSIKNYAATLGNLSKSALKIGATLTGAFSAAGYGLARLIGGTAAETAELGRLAQDLGVSANSLERFTRSFETVGGGADEAVNTIRTLKTEIEAFKVGKGNFEAFGMLGINPDQLGEDVFKNFDVIRNRFKDLTASQRLYWVNQIGLGEKALRVLRLNDKEWQSLQASSNQAPLANKNQIAQSERYERAVRRLTQSFTSFKRELVVGVTPAFTKFADSMAKLFGDKNFQKDVSNLLENLFKNVLPAIVKGAPLIIEQVKNITASIGELSDKITTISDSKFMKLLDMMGRAFMVPAQLGEWGADIIDSQIEGALTPRGQNAINPKTGKISSQLGPMSRKQMIESGVLSMQAIDQMSEGPTPRFRHEKSAPVTNNISINVAGTNASAEDIAKAVDKVMAQKAKEASQNFKSGQIQ